MADLQAIPGIQWALRVFWNWDVPGTVFGYRYACPSINVPSMQGKIQIGDLNFSTSDLWTTPIDEEGGLVDLQFSDLGVEYQTHQRGAMASFSSFADANERSQMPRGQRLRAILGLAKWREFQKEKLAVDYFNDTSIWTGDRAHTVANGNVDKSTDLYDQFQNVVEKIMDSGKNPDCLVASRRFLRQVSRNANMISHYIQRENRNYTERLTDTQIAETIGIRRVIGSDVWLTDKKKGLWDGTAVMTTSPMEPAVVMPEFRPGTAFVFEREPGRATRYRYIFENNYGITSAERTREGAVVIRGTLS